MGALQNALFILLGWVLGLLSQGLIELIRRRRQRVELKRSLFIELEGVRISLAAMVYQIAANNGAVDRKLLILVESILRTDKIFPELGPIADQLSHMLQLSDVQLASAKAARKPGALGLKTIPLPFLNSQLSSLSLFSTEFQRKALKIASRLSIMNEEIDASNFYHKKTFESLSEQNHSTVVVNMLGCYQNLFLVGQPLIDDITVLLSMAR